LFGPLVLSLMVLKTGLHGHGPEFIPEEINWVLNRIPMFMILGTLISSGLGALFAGFTGNLASK